MRRSIHAFTLVELLTVIGIVSVLAAVLFPVFVAAKRTAQKSVCTSNLHQSILASNLYSDDYDDRFVLPRYEIAHGNTDGQDRLWPQLLQPYLKSFRVLHCPADADPDPVDDGLFDSDLPLNDPDARYYAQALRSNIGYNYLYLSPIVSVLNQRYEMAPKTRSDIYSPETTIEFLDSTSVIVDEERLGGYLVSPPCRYAQQPSSRIADTFDGDVPDATSRQYYAFIVGWNGENGRGLKYGGVWPRHFNTANVVMVGGSVRAMSMNQLSRGCDVKPQWGGLISSMSDYFWDVR